MPVARSWVLILLASCGGEASRDPAAAAPLRPASPPEDAQLALLGGSCVVDDLCLPADDPCVVAVTHTVGPSCVFDLGGRTLQVTVSGELDGDAATGFDIVGARDVIIDVGGRLEADGTTTSPGGDIFVSLSDAYTQSGVVDVSGESGGDLTVWAGGPITVLDNVLAQGIVSDGDGGSIDLDAGGALLVDVTLDAHGGNDGAGGAITLWATRDIEVTGDLNVDGGEFDGGSIDIASEGSVFVDTTVLIDADGGGEGGWGGDISVYADEALDFGAVVTADGGAALGWAGDGGSVVLETWSDDLTVRSDITAKGPAPDGWGGAIELYAGGDLVSEGALKVLGSGAGSGGGDVVFDAGGAVTITALVDASGKESGGGSVDVWAWGDVTVDGDLITSGGSGLGDAGDLSLYSGHGTVTISSLVENKADTGGVGGPIAVEACGIDVTATGILRADRNGGENALVARESLTVSGTLDADLANTLTYRLTPPTVAAGATVTPVAAMVADPTLVSCCVDGDGDGVCNADDACPGSDDAIDVDADAVPDACDPDLLLHVPAVAPLPVALTFEVTGGTPGATVWLVRSDALGASSPAGCATALGLASPVAMASAVVAADRKASIVVNVPARVSGRTTWWQLFEDATCRVGANLAAQTL